MIAQWIFGIVVGIELLYMSVYLVAGVIGGMFQQMDYARAIGEAGNGQ